MMPRQHEHREDTAGLAEYACDRCRVRKVTCSREVTGCQRCRRDGNQDCQYSRTGIIRRDRKRKASVALDTPAPDTGASTELLSHLAPDVELAERQMGADLEVKTALESLSAVASSIWVESPDNAPSSGPTKLHMFAERAEEFATVFALTMAKGRPLMCPPPPEVLEQLRSGRPHLVRERAWLVMFYSTILSWTTSVKPDDNDTKSRLRTNLWLAFNDARILLEPSDVNIQALWLLAVHVEEFTTPTLCWMLVSTACRMLQALGIDDRRLTQQQREHRGMLFWNLELMDKGLALIFGRTPANHRALARRVPMPTVRQLLAFRPHTMDDAAPATFGAHFLHQIILLSQLMSKIWTDLHDEDHVSEQAIIARLVEADAWYDQAYKVLDAAAITEKPFLDDGAIRSIELGLLMTTFQYHYLVVLLCRSFDSKRVRRVESSRQLLHMLPGMISDSQEVFNGMVWQLVCSPFTAFLVLLREVSCGDEPANDTHNLEAMERLPVFLAAMARSSALAAKLEAVAVVLLKHGRRKTTLPEQSLLTPGLSVSPAGIPLSGTTAEAPPYRGLLSADEPALNDLDIWSQQLFGEPLFDWLSSDVVFTDV